MCQLMSELGTVTGVTEEMALRMTHKSRDDSKSGAKWLFAAWYVYVSLIWSLKGTMLALFGRHQNIPRREIGEMGLHHLHRGLPGYNRGDHESLQTHPQAMAAISVRRRTLHPKQIQVLRLDHNERPDGPPDHLHTPSRTLETSDDLGAPTRLDLGLNWSVRETASRCPQDPLFVIRLRLGLLTGYWNTCIQTSRRHPSHQRPFYQTLEQPLLRRPQKVVELEELFHGSGDDRRLRGVAQALVSIAPPETGYQYLLRRQ
ncbi:hypothetical protein PG994_005881 [Apiospora phragmitis]|uniref:Uncharacterized protein n=1 Tax=Apiospora phragmitis TaxID=2905665 RepID=A0ABR1VDH8_9PEZI